LRLSTETTTSTVVPVKSTTESTTTKSSTAESTTTKSSTTRAIIVVVVACLTASVVVACLASSVVVVACLTASVVVVACLASSVVVVACLASSVVVVACLTASVVVVACLASSIVIVACLTASVVVVTCLTSSVVVCRVACSKVDAVIERTVLCNGSNNRLVIGGRVDSADTVIARSKTISNICRQDSIIGNIVETLKESEDLRVGGSGLCKATVQQFNDNMGMSTDDTSSVKLLWCCEVVLLSVDEVTCFEIVDGELNLERLIVRNRAAVGRVDKLCRRHPVDIGNQPNGGGIA